MALLVLLPAAAGAGVVAAYLLPSPALLRLVAVGTAAIARGCGQLALLLLVEFLLQRVYGGLRATSMDGNFRGRRGKRNAAAAVHYYRLLGTRHHGRTRNVVARARCGFHRPSVGADDLHAEQEPAGVFLELVHHAFKQIE